MNCEVGNPARVSTHSRAEAAANKLALWQQKKAVSTHSRAEAAAQSSRLSRTGFTVSTHSRAEAAAGGFSHLKSDKRFQHTAARRRLPLMGGFLLEEIWFQHTAARRRLQVMIRMSKAILREFQHTAARRRLRY